MATNDVILSVGADTKALRASVEKSLSNIALSIDANSTNIRKVIEAQTKGIKLDFNASEVKKLKDIFNGFKKIPITFDAQGSAKLLRNQVQSYFDKNPIVIKTTLAEGKSQVAKVKASVVNAAKATATAQAAVSEPSISVKPVQNSTKALQDNTAAAKAASGATQEYVLATGNASKAAATFAERVGFTTARLAAYLIPAATIFQLSRAFRFAAASISDTNAEVNRLTQVLGRNGDQAQNVADRALEIGAKYGQAGKAVLSMTVLLAQAGRQFQDTDTLLKTVESLSKTPLAATFGTVEETTQGLIAVLNQFNKTGGEANHVLDVANELAKKYAFEASDLFTAVQTGGAAFSVAGGNIEEFTAVVAALRQTTRLSASTIGTGLNTIALRSLRPDVIKFTEELTGGKVRNADGTLKNITQRFIEIGKALRNANDEQIAFANEKLAGDRQGKLLVPLLRDIGKGEGKSDFLEALDLSKKSAGSFSRDTAIGLERIDIQLQSIGARFEQVFAKLANDKSIQKLVGEFVTLSKTVASTIEIIAPFLPLLIKLGALKFTLGIATNIGGYLRGIRQSKQGQLTPGGVADLTTNDSDFSLALRKAAQPKGDLSSAKFIATQTTNTKAIADLSSAIQPIAKQVATSAPIIKDAFNRVPVSVTRDNLGERFRTIHPRDTTQLITPKTRPQPFDAYPPFMTALGNNPELVARTRSKFIANRTEELVGQQLAAGQLTGNVTDVTRQRLIQERASSLVKGNPAVKLHPEELLAVASDRTLAAVQKLEEESKGLITTGQALQRASQPLERRFAALSQATKEIGLLPASEIAGRAKPEDIQRAQATAIATARPIAQQQAIAEINQTGVTGEQIFREHNAREYYQASQYARRQRFAHMAANPISRAPVGIEPITGGSLSPFTFGAVESTTLPLGTAIRRDRRLNIARQGQEDLARMAQFRTTARAIPEELVGRPVSGGVFGPPTPEVTQKRIEAAQRSAVRGGLETRLLDVTTDQRILKTSIAELSTEIQARAAQFRKQGFTLEQTEKGLQNFSVELTKQQVALEQLTIEEKELAIKLASASPGLPATGPGLLSRTGSRIGQAARSAGSALRSAAPTIAGLGLSMLLEHQASSVENRNQGLLDQNGKVKRNIAEITGQNQSNSISASTFRGAGTGALLGTMAGPWGIAIGTALGAAIGFGIAKFSRSSAFNKSIQDLYGAASTTENIKDLALPLGVAFDKIKEENKVGALDSGTKVTRRAFSAGVGGSNVVDIVEKGPTFKELFAKSLTGEKSEALIENVRRRAIDEARRIGPQRGKTGEQIQQTVLGNLTQSLSKQLQEEAKASGKTLSAKDAEAQASQGLSAIFEKLGPELGKSFENLNTEMVKAQDATNHMRDSFFKLSASLTEFADTFNQKTREIGTSTLNRGISNQVGNQFNESLFKQAGVFQIPEQVGTALGQNLQNALNKVSDRKIASNIISSSTGGLLDQKEQAVFADTALIQNFVKGISTSSLKSLAGKTFTEGQGPDVQTGLENFVNKIFEQNGSPEVQTDEGINRLKEIKDAILKQARSQPEAFKADPAAFVQGLLGEFADGKIFLERFNAVVANANEKFKTLGVLYDRARQPLERQIQLDTQLNNVSLSRLKEQSTVFGTSEESTIAGLSKIIEKNSVPDLGAAAKNLTSAQDEAKPFLDTSGNFIKNMEGAAEAQLRLRNAQDQYTDAVTKSNDSLAVLRAKFEETSKLFANFTNANKTLGLSSRQDRLQGKVALGRFQNFTGNLLGPGGALAGIQNERDIGKALKEGRVTQGQLDQARKELGRLSDLPSFQDTLNILEKFGGSKLPGGREGQTVGDITGLIRVLEGLGNNPFDTNDKGFQDFINAARDQVSSSDAIRTVEDQQLDTLKTINSTLTAIAKRYGIDIDKLIKSPAVNPPAAPIAPVAQVQPVQTTVPQTKPVNNSPVNKAPAVAPVEAGRDVSERARLESERSFATTLALILQNSKDKGAELLSSQLETFAKAIKDSRGHTANVKFDGNFNLSGFEAVGKDVVAAGAVTKILESFITQLRTGSTQEQEMANKLSNALKLVQGDKGK